MHQFLLAAMFEKQKCAGSSINDLQLQDAKRLGSNSGTIRICFIHIIITLISWKGNLYYLRISEQGYLNVC